MQKIIGHGSHSTATMFPYLINFHDFKDDELIVIFGRLVKKKWDGKMSVEGGEDGLFVRVATRRVGRGRGMDRFGNARAVEALVGRVWERQVIKRAVEREKKPQASKPAQDIDSPSTSHETDSGTLEGEQKVDPKMVPEGTSAAEDEGSETGDGITSSETEGGFDNSIAALNVVSVASESDTVIKVVDTLAELQDSGQAMADEDDKTGLAKEQ